MTAAASSAANIRPRSSAPWSESTGGPSAWESRLIESDSGTVSFDDIDATDVVDISYAVASAPVPPSNPAMRCSNTSVVGFMRRV